MIVLWNTIYIQAALDQIRAEVFTVLKEDVARPSPLVHHHITMFGRYSFAVPESVTRANCRRSEAQPMPIVNRTFCRSPNPRFACLSQAAFRSLKDYHGATE